MQQASTIFYSRILITQGYVILRRLVFRLDETIDLIG